MGFFKKIIAKKLENLQDKLPPFPLPEAKKIIKLVGLKGKENRK